MAKHAGGRPSEFTQEKADALCFELSQGKSLRTVCKIKGMPSGVTVFKWMREHDKFLLQYEKAKQESADAMAEELIDICNTPLVGDEITYLPNGKKQIKKGDMLGHRRLQIDTRKWLMSKMKPKKYGEHIDVTSDGKPLPTPIYGGTAKV
jgi:hypothetical protein